MEVNVLSFEEYKKRKLDEDFKANENKVNPYNGKVIRTPNDFIEYKRELDLETYAQNKNMINPYTNTEIKTYVEYRKYLDSILLNEYEEYKRKILKKTKKETLKNDEYSNQFSTQKTKNISIVKYLFLFMAIYFLMSIILIILNNLNFKFEFIQISLLSTIIVYIFITLNFGLKKENKSLKSQIYILNDKIQDYARHYSELEKNKEDEYTEKVRILENEFLDKSKNFEGEYNKRKLLLETKEQEINLTKAYVNNIIHETSQKYPWLSTIYAELFYSVDKNTAKELKNKKRPALKASDSVMEIAMEKRELLKNNKMLEYQLHYLESIFPWLEEFESENPYAAYDILSSQDTTMSPDSYDAMKNWLSPQEFSALSQTDKYQLALDRYKLKNKTDWEIGIEFERYIGYLYENNGFKVKYHGATMGLEDMGRDLIVEKNGEILIIQCKRWAKTKTIHEKHIFQLYGSVVVEAVKNPNKKYRGLFVTTTSLSDMAKKCASALNIEIKENISFEDYPLIKCNISKTGEKIYHLPFDQQYDRVEISPNKGECYAYTVKEAESKGFRRAFRWRYDK